MNGIVRVINPGPGPATFQLYPADGFTSSATGVVYSDRGAALTAAGPWIKLSNTSVTLPAKTGRAVGFQVTVPDGSYVGNHVGAIVAENVAAENQRSGSLTGGGLALKINTRVILAVVVTVPGPAAVAIKLGPPTIAEENGTTQVIGIPMDDTGGLLFKPRLVASVSDCAGGAHGRIDRQLDTFVPHTSVVYQWSLGTTILRAGCYTVTATVYDGTTNLSTVTGQMKVTSAVASVNPSGQGGGAGALLPPRSSRRPRKSSMLLGLAGGLDLALLILVIAGIIFFFLLRRRERTEDKEPAQA